MHPPVLQPCHIFLGGGLEHQGRGPALLVSGPVALALAVRRLWLLLLELSAPSIVPNSSTRRPGHENSLSARAFSTSRAVFNACVGGYLKREELEAKVERLGLPEAERQRMLSLGKAALAHGRR